MRTAPHGGGIVALKMVKNTGGNQNQPRNNGVEFARNRSLSWMLLDFLT
jgi:hypothetical protein